MGKGRLDSYYLRAVGYGGRSREKNRNTVPSLQRKLGEWTEIADPHHRSSGSSAQKSKLVSVLWTYSFQALCPFLVGRWAEVGDLPCFPPPPPGHHPPTPGRSQEVVSFPLSPTQGLMAGSPLSGMVNKPLGDTNCHQALEA